MNGEGKEAFYFGYGANASPQIIKTLLGRIPEGFPAILPHHRLYIQPWSAIPAVVRNVLRSTWSVKDQFKRYVIRPKRGCAVKGMLWQITASERSIIAHWEMQHLGWTEPLTVITHIPSGAEIVAETDASPGWDDRLAVSSQKHTQFLLNNRRKMRTAALFHRTVVIA